MARQKYRYLTLGDLRRFLSEFEKAPDKTRVHINVPTDYDDENGGIPCELEFCHAEPHVAMLYESKEGMDEIKTYRPLKRGERPFVEIQVNHREFRKCYPVDAID